MTRESQTLLLLEAKPDPSDLFYNKAVEIMGKQNINWKEITTALLSLPTASDLSSDDQKIISARLASANQIQPKARGLLSLFRISSSQETTVTIANSFLVYPDVLRQQLKHSKRESLIAFALAGLSYMNEIYHDLPEGDEKRDYLTRAVFYGAVHDLLVGAKANGFFYFLARDDSPVEVLYNNLLLVSFPDQQQLAQVHLSLVFENEGPTPIQEIDGMGYFTV